jgi:hypothetical protein
VAVLAASCVLLVAPGLQAQQPPPTHGASGTEAHDHAAHQPQDNAYASLVDRQIKALSDAEIEALLAGEGMGFALAAELNGIAGPLHVLELREELELDATLEARITRIFNTMRTRTATLGAEVVELERTLDRRFTHRHLDAATLRDLTGRIAVLRGEIRAIHLEAHLDVDALLDDTRRARYLELRGYGRSP